MAGFRQIDDFLGSAQVFASALHDVVEERLLGEVCDGRVTVPQLRLLKLVDLTDSYTLGDVASFLKVSNAAASKAVDRLVRRGLLRRTEDQADRRIMHLLLTGAGRRILTAYESARRLMLENIFAQFGHEDLRRASELLDRISAGIVDHSGRSDELCLKCGIYFRERCLVRQLVPRNCFYQLGKLRNRDRKSAVRGQAECPPHHGQGRLNACPTTVTREG